MKRKRLLSLTLATVLTIGSLAGCSSTGINSSKGKSSNEKVTIKLFTGKIETIDVMNEIIDDFNKSQDKIIVKQEYQKDASNIIKTKFASDDVPDIMTTYEQGFADEGKYLDLGQEPEWWNRMSTKMKEACTDVKTGKQYRICTNMTMAGFFYNKDIFKELGIEVPNNWDDFVKNLEKIKIEKPDVIPWFIFGNEAWHLGHLIEFIPHGYIKSTLGTVEAKKAMINNDKAKLRFGDKNGPMVVFAEKLVELQKKGLINADVLTATNDNCVQDFVNGKAAMFSNGMWVLSSLLEANPEMKDKIGFAPYPGYMPDSKPVVLSAEDSGYSISATTKHKEEAIEFLNFLFKAENQKKYSEVAKSPSAFKDVSAEWAPDSIVTQVNNAIDNAVNIGFTNEKPAGFSGDDAGRLVQELLANKYTPETFAKTYEQYWDNGMKNTK